MSSWQAKLKYHPIFWGSPLTGANLPSFYDADKSVNLGANADLDFSKSMGFNSTLISAFGQSTMSSVADRGTGAHDYVQPTRSTMVIKGYYLAVVIAKELRVLDLRAVKKALDKLPDTTSNDEIVRVFERQARYRTVDTDDVELDLDVVQLEFNDTGRFLAILGLRSLFVVDFQDRLFKAAPGAPNLATPNAAAVAAGGSAWTQSNSMLAASSSALLGSATSSSTASTMKCDAFEIGIIDPTFGQSQFIQAHWHPMSAQKSDLLVLSEDGQLRLYNVFADIDRPVHTYHVLTADLARVMSNPYHPEKEIARPIAFVLGQDPVAAAMGPSSDALNPWMTPRRSDAQTAAKDTSEPLGWEWAPLSIYVAMQNGDVYSMCPIMPSECEMARTHLDRLESLIQDLDDDTEERYLADTFFGQLQVKDGATPDTVSITTTFLPTHDACPQLLHLHGPITASMDDPDAFCTDLTTAVALVQSPTDQSDHQVTTVLLTAYATGVVDVLAPSPPEPKWSAVLTLARGARAMADPETETAACVAVESLDLETAGYVRFANDPAFDNRVHAVHDKGAHQLCVQVGRSGSAVVPVVETVAAAAGAANPMVAFAVVADPLLNRSLIGMTAHGALAVELYAFEPVSMPTTDKGEEVVRPLSPQQLDKDKAAVRAAHARLASLYAELPPPVLAASPLAHEPAEGVSEDQVVVLREVHAALSRSLVRLVDHAFDMKLVLDGQFAEMKGAIELLENVKCSTKQPAASVRKYEKKVGKLAARADAILQLWYEAANPSELTPAERAFVDRVRTAAHQLRGVAAQAEHVRKFKDQYVQLAEEEASARRDVDELPVAYQKRIERVLTAQSADIQAMVKLLKDLQVE
ncbi:hypothetical protein AMAG_08571 [Allomyces macrogynus ATCC 38327]|uniref:Uncharacterized protein n=1 Tax=Allomyces macrogynus (strain ATCC 38327) TaxID=578462 RepID=A0A0L0SM34_ALLM3|nr:hypothetical protein AMAG_08571 [Allomyces macrogynus ATCC 38327]|eukprot:KNE63445.1 hypothetical protein AMAG_08571 [Allomyces macrogynus ATCC 38327]